ncbi:MAG: cytochrome d ubiquinol oxidase subunit II [Micrococcales bacterium]|nr:cytochrome d ubiquinol oxidase subunit II [Micrococcales bacterium]MCL2667212.1 cytochrome d ubiquinol oxidase subunit II [Micrococcales bacterium]
MLIDTIIAPLAADVDPAVTEGTAQALVGLLHNMTASPSALQIVWFCLIGVLWSGYLVLEGFDFGVGMLLPFVGKKNEERRAALSTIGPLWDGNEVWLLTAGGATFAAFPEWYATLFPAAYLALFLILLGLIVRAVGFEYRGKVNSPGWRSVWDWCIILGSWIPAVLWGVAFANLVAGARAALDVNQIGPSKIVYDGNFWNLVLDHNGFLLLGGLTTAVLFMAHGSHFLSLKTDGIVRERAEKAAPFLTGVATVVAAVWVVWLGFKFAGHNHLTILVWGGIVVAALALVLSLFSSARKKFGVAFTGTTVALIAAVVIIFGALFPNVINGSAVTLKNGVVADADGKTVVDLSDPIVGYFVLTNVDDTTGIPVKEGGRAPTVSSVVDATVTLFGEGLTKPEAVEGVEAGPVTVALTDAVLGDVLAGNWPAGSAAVLGTEPTSQEQREAYGPCSMSSTKAAVDVTFARVGALLASGAVNYTDITAEPGPEAKALTAAIVGAIADKSLTETNPVAGVVSYENVVTAVQITLARNDLPTDADTVGAVVAAIQNDSWPVAGLSKNAVVGEVEKTVQAAIGQLYLSVQVVVDSLPATLNAVPTTDVVVFDTGMDLTDILIGEVKGWDSDLGLANLNPRIENANGALQALHVLGFLDGTFTPLEPFNKGDVVTGQTMMTSASSNLTLTLMTWVAVLLTPIVLAYQAWSIWTFRKRISAERIPAEAGLEPAK